MPPTTQVKSNPAPGNYPLTDGQKAAYQRDAEEAAAREKSAQGPRKEQLDAGKVTGDEAKAARDLQELSQTNPAAARAASEGVRIDNMSRRSAEEPLMGHFVSITDGEHAGKLATYESNATVDENGYPLSINVRLRDSTSQLVTVAFDDVAPAAEDRR